MRTINLVAFLASLFLIPSFFSCQRDVSDELPNPTLPPPVPQIENVTAIVSGRVLDEQGLPINNALVKAGLVTTSTDLNGYFRLNNVTLNKQAGFVKTEKQGYFTGSRTFMVNKGNNNFVTIQLIKKEITGTFAGSSGGSVTVPNGGTIHFEAGSVVNSNGNTPYTGAVTVSAFFLNPEAANFRNIMPGALRGISSSGSEVGLQSFGMMAVELTGGGGEKLQLANGKPASIDFPIPNSLLSTAPATIPLWYFNDTTGLWKEEGAATRQGTRYTGKTAHFSFWNCDVPYPIVDLRAEFKDQNGIPLVNRLVVIKVVNEENVFGSGYTDTAGVILGKVPANKALQLNIYNKCHTAQESRNIGPFSAATDLGVVTINNQPGPSITFTGSVVTCTGLPVTNGFVDISIDNGYVRAPVTNGNYSITFTRCAAATSSVGLKATDLTNAVQGAGTVVTVTSGVFNAPQLTACGTPVNEWISFRQGSTNHDIVFPPDSVQFTNSSNYNVFKANTADRSISIIFGYMGVPGTIGDFPGELVNTIINGNGFTGVVPYTVKITEYGNIGGYIAGTLSASVVDNNNINAPDIPITVNFKIRRTQ